MGGQGINFRFPVESLLEGQPEGVVRAHRITTNNIVALTRQIASLQAQITAAKAASGAASGAASTVTEIVASGVTSFNGETGEVVYFPDLGTVNDQRGAIAYTTQTDDNGALILLDSIYPIGVTLNFAVSAPWYTWIANYGGGTATLTPSSGTISYPGNPGAVDMPLASGFAAYVEFNGTNWWAIRISISGIVPNDTPAVASEWLDSYDAATGAFGQTQPEFSDISGVAATDQIGTGTPSAGEYVDGGTGAWTALPTPPSVPSFVDNETVSGSGTSWTLANTPAAGCVPQLFVELAGFGLIGLLLGSAAAYGYTISGASITTVSSYSGGALHAWYRD